MRLEDQNEVVEQSQPYGEVVQLTDGPVLLQRFRLFRGIMRIIVRAIHAGSGCPPALEVVQ